jgi:hypothetical protein
MKRVNAQVYITTTEVNEMYHSYVGRSILMIGIHF